MLLAASVEKLEEWLGSCSPADPRCRDAPSCKTPEGYGLLDGEAMIFHLQILAEGGAFSKTGETQGFRVNEVVVVVWPRYAG